MITLRFRYNPAAETADVNEPQIWAHEQFPAITVKSVSAAWNIVRKYRDEAPEVVENEVLEVKFEGGLPHSDRIPKRILFKKNTKGKLEFKDYDKLIVKAIKVIPPAERVNPAAEETTEE